MAEKSSIALESDPKVMIGSWVTTRRARSARVVRECGADKGLVQTMARLDDYVVTLSSTRDA